MFKTTLHQEVSKTVDHQWVRLGHDGLDDLVLLFGSTHLELLLQKDGRLLVVIADNLVHDILPVAIDIAVQKASIVEWLSRRQIGRTLYWRPLYQVSNVL
jgi:hypothetical protein